MKVEFIAIDGTRFTSKSECRLYTYNLVKECFIFNYNNEIDPVEDSSTGESGDFARFGVDSKGTIINIMRLFGEIK